MVLKTRQVLNQLFMLLATTSALVVVLFEDFILVLAVIIFATEFANFFIILRLVVGALTVDLVLVAIFQRLAFAVMQGEQLAEVV